MPKNPLAQARLAKELLARLDKAVAGKVSMEGTQKSRSDGIREAVEMFLAAEGGGAFYASQEERDLVDGLRILSRENPNAAVALRLLLSKSFEDREHANAVAAFVGMVLKVAETAGTQSPDESPQRTGHRGRGSGGKK